jgi:hypothetical protein
MQVPLFHANWWCGGWLRAVAAGHVLCLCSCLHHPPPPEQRGALSPHSTAQQAADWIDCAVSQCSSQCSSCRLCCRAFAAAWSCCCCVLVPLQAPCCFAALPPCCPLTPVSCSVTFCARPSNTTSFQQHVTCAIC